MHMLCMGRNGIDCPPSRIAAANVECCKLFSDQRSPLELT